MIDPIERLLGGFTILARADTQGSRVPCFICSPTTPKFGKGWQVSLDDTGEEALIGHDCALRHLGLDYSMQVRGFEQAEADARRRRQLAAILADDEQITKVCEQTLADASLLAIRDINDVILELSREARRHLSRCAIGEMPSVDGAAIFGPRNPRGAAKDVLATLATLRSATVDTPDFDKTIRSFVDAIAEHNELVRAYGDGRRFFRAKNIKSVNEILPGIDLQVRSGILHLREKSGDRRRRERPIPEALRLAEIRSPF